MLRAQHLQWLDHWRCSPRVGLVGLIRKRPYRNRDGGFSLAMPRSRCCPALRSVDSTTGVGSPCLHLFLSLHGRRVPLVADVSSSSPGVCATQKADWRHGSTFGLVPGGGEVKPFSFSWAPSAFPTCMVLDMTSFSARGYVHSQPFMHGPGSVCAHGPSTVFGRRCLLSSLGSRWSVPVFSLAVLGLVLVGGLRGGSHSPLPADGGGG